MREVMRTHSNTSGAHNPGNAGALDAAAIAAIDRSVGIRLRQRRTLLGLSQQDVAVMMGMSFQQLQKYERGISRISASRLYQLATILNSRVADFFEDASAVSHPDAATEMEVKQLLSAFLALETEAQRRAFTQLVASMRHPARNG